MELRGPAKAGTPYPERLQSSIEAQAKACLCEQFLRLTRDDNYSLSQAARALGKSPSWFSGADSPFQRWLGAGVAGLAPNRGASGAHASFSVPAWFVPAAQFFYLLTNRTRDTGSVPEAVRRAVSLPHLPAGWTQRVKNQFLKRLALSEPPVCPEPLRELILARQAEGKPLVPERIARQIASTPARVRQYRNPTEASLKYLNSPGGMRLWTEADGSRRLARAGEIIEADDATINFPVCVPWQRDAGSDPCVQQFGVKVARFQWLVSIDVATSFITGFSYTARPRSSYRAEDVLSLQRIVVRQHGIPRRWRFERGVWKSNLVRDAIRLMGSELETVYSPHQKPFVEGLFNTLWTKLSVHFPEAHVGRFRGENEAANDLLVACQRGNKDPRKYFPMLGTVIEAFREVIAEKNRTPVESSHHGRWIPEERWERELDLPMLDAQSEWLFSPFTREWKVKGMLVGGRVPLFEDVSVPFDFSAPWLPQWDGARVKCHFDPADPRCVATLVLAERFNGHNPGEVLGSAGQVNETAGYVRLVMGWGEDPANAGRAARQQAAAALRREVRAVLPRGQGGASASEERDGLGSAVRIESGSREDAKPRSAEAGPNPEILEERIDAMRKHFTENPLDFV